MQKSDCRLLLFYLAGIPDMRTALCSEQEQILSRQTGGTGLSGNGKSSPPIVRRPTEYSALRLSEISARLSVLDGDADIIRAALDGLSPRWQRILSLRYLQRYSWAKISLTLHVPAGTVRHWHDRALIRFGDAVDGTPMIREILSRARQAQF